jgi:non-ribosomal peptide synthase protein (TIGR01720 family)
MIMEAVEKPEKGVLTGEVPITPIQKWFFERDLKNIHHFNQSTLLEVKDKITLDMVKTIFNFMAQYHDAFRMRYKLEDDRRYIQSYSSNLSINVEDRVLKKENESEFFEEIHKDATIIQSGLNIFDGPIVQVVLYRCPDNKDRILIVAHHLVVDGVSWRILIDDMETVYGAFMNTGRVSLPAKTHSYRQWANALMRYAQSEEGKNEIKYWQKIENSIKKTFLTSDSESKEKGNDYIVVSFDKEKTRRLIQEVPKKYDTQINDILLTALTLAAGDTSGNYEFSFTLEGHGREDVIGLDVSRTIGWFTSVFPVFLRITDPHDLISSINEVKESLRKIPNKGIGYGILRYCADNFKKPLPKVSFNYLGQWDGGISTDDVFQYAKESSGEDCDQGNESYNLIDMNGGIKNGIFDMCFAYKIDTYKKETIEKFVNQFKRRLLEMIGN